MGVWNRSGEFGFFEEFSLEMDAGERVFNSWLHQGPEISGAAWKLENCRLMVTPRTGGFAPFQLKILGLRKGRLRLYDESDRTESVYLRSPKEP
ncbi:hypothetical protein V1318_21010 [Lysobacter sp. CCNWLW3]|uniref:hypothetical protein n=1 Tax=unclassified Lysobacter TaxID=2635362 RepID=UPI002FD0A880